MANLSKTRTIFAFTSPRTVQKIIPEIKLLINKFSGKKWDARIQEEYFKELQQSTFYLTKALPKDPAFAARDRITRAPKALGFVNLKPTISLTDAGKQLVAEKRTAEVITRQLLKFQLPSPYHKLPDEEFYVKPYLEFLRLLADVGSLSKIEIALFFLQLTHIKKYKTIIKKIQSFRRDKTGFGGSYRTYVDKCFKNEIQKIFAKEIKAKNLKTRESKDDSLEKFIKTKRSNLIDYADAFIRYWRATELISLEKKTFRVIIAPQRKEEVAYILQSTSRIPIKFGNEQTFKKYLFTSDNVKLFTDNTALLLKRLRDLKITDVKNKDIGFLKDLLVSAEQKAKQEKIREVAQDLKNFNQFNDIKEVFVKIRNREIPDPPLYFEWNVWRAMEMLNYAKNIAGNFKIGLDGLPIDTAKGNLPDIEIDYGNFKLIVEVTTSTGATQYIMENESVPRHFGMAQVKSEDPVFCLFVATKINGYTLAHFYHLNKINTKIFGGMTRIIPVNLDQFLIFLEVAREASFNNAHHLMKFLQILSESSRILPDERSWQMDIENTIPQWMKIVSAR